MHWCSIFVASLQLRSPGTSGQVAEPGVPTQPADPGILRTAFLPVNMHLQRSPPMWAGSGSMSGFQFPWISPPATGGPLGSVGGCSCGGLVQEALVTSPTCDPQLAKRNVAVIDCAGTAWPETSFGFTKNVLVCRTSIYDRS